jgi:hypothetical protein
VSGSIVGSREVRPRVPEPQRSVLSGKRGVVVYQVAR